MYIYHIYVHVLHFILNTCITTCIHVSTCMCMLYQINYFKRELLDFTVHVLKNAFVKNVGIRTGL